MPVSDSGGPTAQGQLRDGERLQILGDLRGAVLVLQPITIKEIANGGVQVETDFPFHVDTLHELRLELGGCSVVVKGRVAHCSVVEMDIEVIRYRSGLEFVEVPPHVAAVIDAFIEDVKAGRQGF